MSEYGRDEEKRYFDSINRNNRLNILEEQVKAADALAKAAKAVTPLIQWKYASVNDERLIDDYADALVTYEKMRNGK